MGRQHSDGDVSSASSHQSYHSQQSHLSVQSRPDRTISISPGQDLPPIPNMHRQASDYSYMQQNMPQSMPQSMSQGHSLPPHMRNDYQQQPSARSTPAMNGAPSMNGYASVPQQHRPASTSHPTTYGPPQPLEPPANSTGSGGASPHMNALGWVSPGNGNLPSSTGMDNYNSYPDPTYGGQPLYYPGSNIRRPQSTEPEDYGLRSRHMSHHMANNVPMTADWSAMPNMPMGMAHMKEEKFAI